MKWDRNDANASSKLSLCYVAAQRHDCAGIWMSTSCMQSMQGTESTGMAVAPARLDALRRMRVTAVAAAKFHSMALLEDGRLYSWGFGRGGRTGPHWPKHCRHTAASQPIWSCAEPTASPQM